MPKSLERTLGVGIALLLFDILSIYLWNYQGEKYGYLSREAWGLAFATLTFSVFGPLLTVGSITLDLSPSAEEPGKL